VERIVSWNGSQGAKQSRGKTGQSQMMWLEYAAVAGMERKGCLQERGDAAAPRPSFKGGMSWRT